MGNQQIIKSADDTKNNKSQEGEEVQETQSVDSTLQDDEKEANIKDLKINQQMEVLGKSGRRSKNNFKGNSRCRRQSRGKNNRDKQTQMRATFKQFKQ